MWLRILGYIVQQNAVKAISKRCSKNNNRESIFLPSLSFHHECDFRFLSICPRIVKAKNANNSAKPANPPFLNNRRKCKCSKLTKQLFFLVTGDLSLHFSTHKPQINTPISSKQHLLAIAKDNINTCIDCRNRPSTTLTFSNRLQQPQYRHS